ncbi:MAG: hypothetical protein IPO16_05995 [Saprospiraceae bacterium]|nr:hypothetical protein [Saprospiraceae bacterium]MBK9221658.1 hypothetical protein [Saprospiraceae bacterium]
MGSERHQTSGLRGFKIPKSIDEKLEKRGMRYGLYILASGYNAPGSDILLSPNSYYGRTRSPYIKSMGNGRYLVPKQAVSKISVYIFDSLNDNIAFFGISDFDKSPLDDKNVYNQIRELLNFRFK